MSIFSRAASITFIWPSLLLFSSFFLLFIRSYALLAKCVSRQEDADANAKETKKNEEKNERECILMYGKQARQTMKERSTSCLRLFARCTITLAGSFHWEQCAFEIRFAFGRHRGNKSRRKNARHGGKETTSEKGNDANCVAPPENTFVSQLHKSKWNLAEKE